MRISIIPADRLTVQNVARWSQLQREAGDLDSPFLCPQFTQVVASVRDNVEVGLLQSGDEIVGFFPYQRDQGKVARPVGGALNDCQAAIVRKDVDFNAKQLVRGCGLNAWFFDHLVASQEPFRPHHCVEAVAPYADLSNGFEAYQADRRGSGCKRIKKTLKKERKATREVGPVRLESDSRDRRLLTTLIDWKVQRYREMGVANYLGSRWKVAVLEEIVNRHEEAFSGMLSALYLGDHLAAVELGIRSHGVLHGWFSAYDARFAKYSPGMILWVELAKAASSLGIRRLDLGKGDESYKLSLMSGAVSLAEGAVDFRPLAGTLRRSWLRARDRVRASSLRVPAQQVVRNTRRWLRRKDYTNPIHETGAPRTCEASK